MHVTETELNDYIDGALSESALQRVHAHLLECGACAQQVEQLTALKAGLAGLPSDIVPERDLRPDIWRQIDHPVVADIGQTRRRALWSVRYRLAAAAVVLIVASSAVTLMIVQSQRSGSFEPGGSDVRLVGLNSRALERQYSEEVHELELVLRKSRGALAPETVKILEDNLRIIDNAIREAKAALASDPQSDMLVDLLRSAYERKLELLRHAAKSSPMT